MPVYHFAELANCYLAGSENTQRFADNIIVGVANDLRSSSMDAWTPYSANWSIFHGGDIGTPSTPED